VAGLSRAGTALLQRTLALLDRLPGTRAARAAHLITGEAGEERALFFLRSRGYTVVARQWRSAHARGDIDLIAWRGTRLSFVEVKTRSERGLVPAHVAVDEQKRSMLRRMARLYLRRLPAGMEPAARFDVISVYLAPGGEEIDFFPAAFGWTERPRAGFREG
jgi:putative endonuclease